MHRPTLFLASLLSLTACGAGSDALLVEASLPDFTADADALRAPGSENWRQTVDVGSWNVEWLGDPEHGPADEALQVGNVGFIARRLDLDLLGLVEVVSPTAFSTLLEGLPNHRGLLSTDPQVEGGAASYAPGEQKVALVYNERFTVTRARVVLTEHAYDFAGRPPLEVSLRFEEGGRPRTLVVLVAHLKAMANADGYLRRRRSGVALEQFLTAEHASRWVLVVGDWNDKLQGSTWRGATESPFAALASNPEYAFTTAGLTASTTVNFSSTIDHHLATDELAARFVPGSAKVLRLDDAVRDYGTTTSDHYPVLTRYDLR